MSLVLRATKGSALTHAEGDGNFQGLADGSLIEAGAITDTHLGQKVGDPTLAGGSSSGTLTQLLSWLMRQVKAIGGETNWWDTPAVSLKSHVANSNHLPPGVILPFGGVAAPTGFLSCDGSAVSRTTYADLFAAIGTTWGVGNGSSTFNVPSLARKTLVGSGGVGTATLANSVGSTGGTETIVLDATMIPSHTHTQNSHNHTQDVHTHTQNSHTHTDSGHTHTFSGSTGGISANHTHSGGVSTASSLSGAGSNPTPSSSDFGQTGTVSSDHTHAYSGTTSSNPAVISTVTATNQNTTATNQAATATNQNTGGGLAHDNMQPSAVALYIIKT